MKTQNILGALFLHSGHFSKYIFFTMRLGKHENLNKFAFDITKTIFHVK